MSQAQQRADEELVRVTVLHGKYRHRVAPDDVKVYSKGASLRVPRRIQKAFADQLALAPEEGGASSEERLNAELAAARNDDGSFKANQSFSDGTYTDENGIRRRQGTNEEVR